MSTAHSVLAFIVVTLFVVLGVIAQRYRVQRDDALEAVEDGRKWIDEIIEALENPDEAAGNDALDSLLVRAGE